MPERLRYRTLAEDLPALVCCFQDDGTLTFVNEKCCFLWGKKREQVLGFDYFSFIPTVVRENIKGLFQTVNLKKPFVHYEFETTAPDGSQCWLRWTVHALFKENGELQEYQAMGKDLREEKQGEVLRRAREELLSFLAETRDLSLVARTVLLKLVQAAQFQAGIIKFIYKDECTYTGEEIFPDCLRTNRVLCLEEGVYQVENQLKGKKQTCYLYEKGCLQNNKDNTSRRGVYYTDLQDEMGAVLNDPSLHGEHYCRECLDAGFKSMVLLPLQVGREMVGMIQLYDLKAHLINPELVNFLESIAPTIAFAIKHLQNQDALQVSEARFRLLAENARDLIFRVTLYPELKFDYISPASSTMFGYSPREHYENSALIFELIHPEDRELLEQAMKGKVTVKTPLKLRFKHKKGHYIWVENQNVPFYDEQGRIVALEGISRDVTERVKNEQRLRANRKKIQALSARVLHAFEEERARLARELHDEVGHSLAAVSMDLQFLEFTLASLEPPQKERLSGSIKLLGKTLLNLRRQIHALRPPSLDKLGLVEVVRHMVEDLKQRAGLEMKMTATGFAKRLPSTIETALYRCVQEALTNVLRHADARGVAVELCHDKGRVRLKISDDGVGFHPSASHLRQGMGLTGMRERVDLLEGKMKVNSAPGRGTEIAITIPVQEAAPHA